MEAILQATSDLVVDSGRDTLDTAAAGETAGRGRVSVSVLFKVPGEFSRSRTKEN